VPAADFFTRFRLFVLKDALDPELCARVRYEMQSACRSLATVRAPGHSQAYNVDATVRSAKWVDVEELTVSLVEARLLDLKPAVERHFNVALNGCQQPQFLAYREGDFYLPHRDRPNDPDAAVFAVERKVSVVMFLNSESPEPHQDAYGGGALTFYGLMDTPLGKSVGIPLVGQSGLLIAFPSEIPHEVQPVTYGERYTIVSWYV
jgi:SM-20-related protein